MIIINRIIIIYILVYILVSFIIFLRLYRIMKRKIVQQGYSTMMVSLPSNWVKKNNLIKGDEINIDAIENDLIVSTEEKKEVKKIINLNIEDVEPLRYRMILAAFRRGYDIINIEYKTNSISDKIQQKVLPEMIGFEIIEQKKNSCIIAEVSKTTDEEFDNILKRSFYTIKNMFSDLIKSIENNEKDLDYIKTIDKNLNKYVHFCERILNKESQFTNDKILSLNYIVLNLEVLGDAIKDLSECIKNEKNIKKNEFELLKNTSIIFENLLSLFYNNSIDKTIEFSKKYKMLNEKYNFKTNIENKIKQILEIIIRIFDHNLTFNIDKF